MIIYLLPAITLGVAVIILAWFVGQGNDGLFWYIFWILVAMVLLAGTRPLISQRINQRIGK